MSNFERYRIADLRFTRGLSERRVWLEATAAGERQRVTIDVSGAPLCTLDGAPARWPLWNGLPMGVFNLVDPLLQLTQWAHFHTGARGRACRDAMREVYAIAQDTAVHAAGRCDPRVRRIALRFATHARWFVFEAMMADATGRTAQMFAERPGVALLLRVFRERGLRDAEVAMREAIRRGDKLRTLIDAALEAWWHHAVSHDTDPERDAPWKRMRDATTAQRRRILSDRRLLLGRAPAGVPTTVMWLPPPLSFRADDLPAGARARVDWFRITTCTTALLGPVRGLDPAAQAELTSFVSRNALDIARAARERNVAFSRLVRGLIATAEIENRWPRRRSSLVKLLDTHDRHYLNVGEGFGRYPLETPLPAPSWPKAAVRDDVQVRPLRTVRALVQEAARMRNCLASMAGKVIDGRAYLCAAIVEGERLTLEIDPQDLTRIVQIKRKRNEPVTRRQRRLVRSWLAAANRQAEVTGTT